MTLLEKIKTACDDTSQMHLARRVALSGSTISRIVAGKKVSISCWEKLAAYFKHTLTPEERAAAYPRKTRGQSHGRIYKKKLRERTPRTIRVTGAPISTSFVILDVQAGRVVGRLIFDS